MAQYESNFSAALWSGTAQDIIQLARVAAEEVGKWDLKSTPIFDIDVEFGDSQAKDLSELDFEKLATVHLKEFDSITVLAGQSWFQSGVRIAFRSGFRAIRVSVTGTDQARVEGVRNILKDHLRKGVRWRGWALRTPAVAALVGLVIGWFVSIELPWSLRPGQRSSEFVAVTVGYGIFWILLAGYALISWLLVPTLELLPSGERTRLRRWRGVVGTVVLAVVLAVIVGWALAGHHL